MFLCPSRNGLGSIRFGAAIFWLSKVTAGRRKQNNQKTKYTFFPKKGGKCSSRTRSGSPGKKRRRFLINFYIKIDEE